MTDEELARCLPILEGIRDTLAKMIADQAAFDARWDRIEARRRERDAELARWQAELGSMRDASAARPAPVRRAAS